MLHVQNTAIVVPIKIEEQQNLEGMHTKGFLKRCVNRWSSRRPHPPTSAAPQSTPHRYDIFKIIVSYMLRTIIPVGSVPPASAELGGISFVCRGIPLPVVQKASHGCGSATKNYTTPSSARRSRLHGPSTLAAWGWASMKPMLPAATLCWSTLQHCQTWHQMVCGANTKTCSFTTILLASPSNFLLPRIYHLTGVSFRAYHVPIPAISRHELPCYHSLHLSLVRLYMSV